MYSLLKRFNDHRGGNFALMTSVLSIPLVMGIGLAIDASSIARNQAALQQAVDSAVLAIASEGKDVTDDRAKEIAQRYLAGNSDLNLSLVTVTRNGVSFKLKAMANTAMSFGGLLGYDSWPVLADSSADIAYVSYEVGLVLDTTGSMAGGKLSSMKDAVNGMIDSMSAQVTDKDKLKFALVPFSSFVNVGPGYGPKFDSTGKQIDGTGASWLDLTGASPVPQSEFPQDLSRFQVYNNVGKTWAGCVESRPTMGSVDYATIDAVPDASKPETLFVPSFAIDEEDKGGYWNSYFKSSAKTLDTSPKGIAKKLKKYGVPVDDKGKSIEYGKKGNTNVDSIPEWVKTPVTVGGEVAGYPIGPSFGCVAAPIAPLTNDYASIKKQVDALTANGNTNIMEGVAWGMRVLSPGEPFAQGKPTGTSVKKMMVVLTDGSNTFGNNATELGSIYSSFGFLVEGRIGITSGGTNATNDKMNQRTLAACAAAKADGVEVYTIRLEEPNVTTGTMLKECASSPANYYDVPSRTQLDEVFSKIRDQMVLVRMSS
jgi:Flp pilus assembly protein TadG